MVNNAVLTLLIIRANQETQLVIRVFSWLFIASFIIEALMSMYLIYSRRNENNFQLFKKIGADKRINKAFSTRKLLESSGSLNVFMASVIFMKLILPPKTTIGFSSFSILIFTVFTYTQQLFISVGINEERVGQRK
jgi:hypothetical protein